MGQRMSKFYWNEVYEEVAKVFRKHGLRTFVTKNPLYGWEEVFALEKRESPDGIMSAVLHRVYWRVRHVYIIYLFKPPFDFGDVSVGGITNPSVSCFMKVMIDIPGGRKEKTEKFLRELDMMLKKRELPGEGDEEHVGIPLFFLCLTLAPDWFIYNEGFSKGAVEALVFLG